jgi:hypothetical protein
MNPSFSCCGISLPSSPMKQRANASSKSKCAASVVVGYCKSMTGAVMPFERLRKRTKPEPTDKIFGPTNRDMLNAVLGELNLKFDRDGNRRTAYSL